MLSGDNGILQKATDAKTRTDRAQIIENAQMDILGKQTENHGTLSEEELVEILTSDDYNTKGTLSDNNEESVLQKTLTSSNRKYHILVSEIYNGSLTTIDSGKMSTGPNGKPLVNQGTISELTTEKIIGEDKLGNQIVIPEGFKLAQGENGSGETVKEGIVIEDAEKNQYVWIPVSNIDGSTDNPIVVEDDVEGNRKMAVITLGRYKFDETTGVPPLTEGTYQYANTCETPVIISSYYKELTTYRESNGKADRTGTNTSAQNIAGFINSVGTNKGYYLARYEASYRTNGKAGSIPSTSNAETLALTSAPATRIAGDLWNFVKQGEAATACYDLYTSVNSDLVNSYAWDTAILYIQAMGNENYAYANRENIFLNTGTTGDEKCKIFDMGGNSSEWTTELSSQYNNSYAWRCVLRGTSRTDYRNYTGGRSYQKATDVYRNASFRSVLWL